MRRYRAMLVGNWHYPDDPANLPDLKGPINDVSRLAEALADPAMGLFSPDHVTTLTERASYEIVAELETFFGDATRDDVLLLYYSGHGITADNGALLLCARNSRTDRRLASTVSADTVNQMITACPAAAVVIVLDCCHAGAFKSGGIADDLGGKGRYVLTASRAKDRAPDAEHATGLSRFTGHLLRGIQGEAAIPGADHITLSDVYRYVHRRMTEDGPVIPQRRFDGDGEVAIARHHGVPPSAAAGSPAPSLVVSGTTIDLGPVRVGEVLPLERIQVSARDADGAPAPWWAETEADWIFVQSHPHHLDVRVTPRTGASRANIHVRNSVTGEIHTIRLTAQPTDADTPLPPDRPAEAPAQPVSQSTVAPATGGQATIGRATVGRATVGQATVGQATVRPSAAPQAVGEAARAQPSPPPGGSGPRATTVLDGLIAALARQPIAGLTVRPATRTRSESAARRTAAVADSEVTVGALDLEGDGFVLFTDQAMHWTNQRQSAAVHYRQFAARSFTLRPPSHVVLGDGVPRLVGPRAAQLVALLNEIRARLPG